MGRLGLMIGVIGWYAHWAAWLAIADAGSFTGLPRSLARTAAETPFCELTDAWAVMLELPRKFAWIDEAHVAVHRRPRQGRQPKPRLTRLRPIRRSWSRPSTTEMPDAHCLTSS